MPAGGAGAVHRVGAALERAAVLAARHDFLARVAALLEVDAAQQLEVQHLRHELLDGRGHDAGHAAAHLEPAPGIRARAPASGGCLRRRPRGSATCRRRRAGGSPGQPPCSAAATRLRPAPQRRPVHRPTHRPGRTAATRRWRRSSLHLARSTNIDRRFSVAGSRSALQASRISSSAPRQTTKLASRRPLGEQ